MKIKYLAWNRFSFKKLDDESYLWGGGGGGVMFTPILCKVFLRKKIARMGPKIVIVDRIEQNYYEYKN